MKHGSKGIGLPSAIFLVFLVLKLLGVITWSWLWVLSPLWIGAILYVIFVFIYLKFLQ